MFVCLSGKACKVEHFRKRVSESGEYKEMQITFVGTASITIHSFIRGKKKSAPPKYYCMQKSKECNNNNMTRHTWNVPLSVNHHHSHQTILITRDTFTWFHWWRMCNIIFSHFNAKVSISAFPTLSFTHTFFASFELSCVKRGHYSNLYISYANEGWQRKTCWMAGWKGRKVRQKKSLRCSK